MLPASRVAVDGSTLTVGAGSVMVAAALRVESVTEVAVMVTVTSLAGAVGGAVYVTEVLVALLRVPALEVGETDQVTPLCAGSLCTVAVKVCVPPASMVADEGSMNTESAGTVTMAAALRVALVTEVAVIVTFRSLAGALAGAV
jgi:hypothetical protein